jgi:hypothetical protein
VRGAAGLSVVMIGDFGRDKEGIYTYRINATGKDDLYELIQAVRNQGWKFFDTPNILKAHKTYSVLLKLYKPSESGYPEESQG